MKMFGLVIVVLVCQFAWSESMQQDTVVTSCSLFIKTTVFAPDSFDNTGTAKIEATLTDKQGNPIVAQKINLLASSGNLTCKPPLNSSESVADSSDGGCYLTGENGVMKVYLVNIPFNKAGKVKATCTYGNFHLKAGGSYVVTRKTIRRK